MACKPSTSKLRGKPQKGNTFSAWCCGALPFATRNSSRGPTSVDENGVTGDEGCGRRCQEYDGAGDVHGITDAMQPRDAFDHVSAEGRVGECFVRAGRGDERGCDGVNGDVVLAPFYGETLG